MELGNYSFMCQLRY